MKHSILVALIAAPMLAACGSATDKFVENCMTVAELERGNSNGVDAETICTCSAKNMSDSLTKPEIAAVTKLFGDMAKPDANMRQLQKDVEAKFPDLKDKFGNVAEGCDPERS